jgi:membrane protein DedA with SNARE-associated domain
VSSANLLERLRNPELDLLGYVSLFVACWIGAGGALVPIPGVRALSWVMIIQQGAALDPLVVALIAASAMVLGQSSYFVATRTAQNRRQHASASAEAATVDSEAGEPDDDLATETDTDTHRHRMPAFMTRAADRIQRQIHRHGFLTVFAVCALPTPLTTLTTTAAAGSGMGYARYAVAAFAGFMTLSTVLAFLGDNLFGGIFPLNR